MAPVSDGLAATPVGGVRPPRSELTLHFNDGCCNDILESVRRDV